MRPIVYTFIPAAAADNNIAASQSPGAGAITLTALAAGPIDPQTALLPGDTMSSLGLGRIVIITSGGNDTGINFTITGKDENGNAATETFAGANGAAAPSTKFYTSVSSITHTGNVASTVKAGTRNTSSSAAYHVIPLDFYNRIGSLVQVDVSGTISYTVQETFDDCLTASTISGNTFFATPASPTALTAQSSAAFTQLPPAVRGIRVTIPTYTSTGSITVNVVSPFNH